MDGSTHSTHAEAPGGAAKAAASGDSKAAMSGHGKSATEGGPAAATGRPAHRPPRRAAAWASKDVLRAAVVILGLYFGVQLVWLVHPVILTGFVGLLFGLAVARGADLCERVHVPRGIAAALIVLSTYAALGGVLAIAAPTLGKQFGELRRRLPEALDRVDQWLAANKTSVWGQILSGTSEGETEPGAPQAGATQAATPQAAAGGILPPPTPASRSGASIAGLSGAQGRTAALPAEHGAAGAGAVAAERGGGGGARGAGAVPAAQGGGAAATAAPGAAPPGSTAPAPSPLRARLLRQLGAATRYLFPFLSSTVEVLAGLLLITFVAIYYGVDPGVYRRGLLHLVPHPSRARADEVLTAIGLTLRRWLGTQLIAMFVIGSMVSIALALLGVEAALSLGIIAGVLEFIPTVGPILSAMPAIAMGFLVSPQKALAVAVVFTLVQMVEGHVLIPMLMKRGMNLPPLLTILGQAVMAVVFGFLGLLVAVPLLAMVLTTVKMLYVNDVMGDGVRTGASASSG